MACASHSAHAPFVQIERCQDEIFHGPREPIDSPNENYLDVAGPRIF